MDQTADRAYTAVLKWLKEGREKPAGHVHAAGASRHLNRGTTTLRRILNGSRAAKRGA